MKAFLTAVAMCASLAVSYAAEVYRHAATKIELPESIAGFERGKVSPYGEGTDEPGEFITFQSADAVVTIYIRKLAKGSKKDPADYVSESLEATKALKAASEMKVYDVGGEQAPRDWKPAAYSGRMGGDFVVSFISCALRSDHLVKIRATTGNPKNGELLVFLREILEVIDLPK